jgi:hypothetical protein
LVLLLLRAEHSAVLACAQAHRDGCPDEPDREAEGLDQLQVDAAQSEPSAWDAWDGARRGEAVDAFHQLRALLADGDAGKSADPERVVRAQDASSPRELPLALLALAEQDAEAEPCRPDAAQSGEQSCAAQVFAARQQPAERLGAARSKPRKPRAMPTQSSMALRVQAEIPQPLEALRDERVAQRLPGPKVRQAAQRERPAFQPLAAQSLDAQRERVSEERKREPAVQTEPRVPQASLPEPRLWASGERPAARSAVAQAQRQLPSSA